MTQRQVEIIALLRRALGNVPCICQHNVPYAGCAETQVVMKQCQRCKALAAARELDEVPA